MALQLCSDGPEYVKRTQSDFRPPDCDVQALRDAVPKAAFERNTMKALIGIAPVVIASVTLFVGGLFIDTAYDGLSARQPLIFAKTARWSLWAAYWIAESIAWAGLWTIGMARPQP